MTGRSPLPAEVRQVMRDLAEQFPIGRALAMVRDRFPGVDISERQVKRARYDAIERRKANLRAGVQAKPSSRSADEKRTPWKPPIPFEEQLARVAAGAAVVPTFRCRKAPPDMTMGGVSAGLLG